MKIAIFTILIILAVSVAFWAGQVTGPLTNQAELQRLKEMQEHHGQERHLQELDDLRTNYYLVRNIDKGDLATAKRHLNGKIDFWMIENSAHARNGRWIKPTDTPDRITSFLALVAWHRKQYPVEYENASSAQDIAAILEAAVVIEKKRDK
jgi:hypothetical protein